MTAVSASLPHARIIAVEIFRRPDHASAKNLPQLDKLPAEIDSFVLLRLARMGDLTLGKNA
jgi:hypothetical protein